MQVAAGFVLDAGAKAKTVTNNLPILSVLGVELVLKLSRYKISMFWSFLVKGGRTSRLFCSFWFEHRYERAANVPDIKYCISCQVIF
jgi:hypothetical protein